MSETYTLPLYDALDAIEIAQVRAENRRLYNLANPPRKTR